MSEQIRSAQLAIILICTVLLPACGGEDYSSLHLDASLNYQADNELVKIELRAANVSGKFHASNPFTGQPSLNIKNTAEAPEDLSVELFYVGENEAQSKISDNFLRGSGSGPDPDAPLDSINLNELRFIGDWTRLSLEASLTKEQVASGSLKIVVTSASYIDESTNQSFKWSSEIELKLMPSPEFAYTEVSTDSGEIERMWTAFPSSEMEDDGESEELSSAIADNFADQDHDYRFLYSSANENWKGQIGSAGQSADWISDAHSDDSGFSALSLFSVSSSTRVEHRDAVIAIGSDSEALPLMACSEIIRNSSASGSSTVQYKLRSKSCSESADVIIVRRPD